MANPDNAIDPETCNPVEAALINTETGQPLSKDDLANLPKDIPIKAGLVDKNTTEPISGSLAIDKETE